MPPSPSLNSTSTLFQRDRRPVVGRNTLACLQRNEDVLFDPPFHPRRLLTPLHPHALLPPHNSLILCPLVMSHPERWNWVVRGSVARGGDLFAAAQPLGVGRGQLDLRSEGILRTQYGPFGQKTAPFIGFFKLNAHPSSAIGSRCCCAVRFACRFRAYDVIRFEGAITCVCASRIRVLS